MPLFDSLSAMGKETQMGGTGNSSSGSRMHWGKVVSNRDPRMLCRIKVKFNELMPWEEPDFQPWMFPLYPAGLGSAPLSNFFCIPEEQTYVTCIFPANSVYFGYYVWHSTDRQRRMVDFMSEYPERYGWQDSRENKMIVNKTLDIDTVEHRYADGGTSIYDSFQNRYTYTDKFGTVIFADRRDQHLSIQFGGVHLQIKEGRLKLEGSDLEFKALNALSLIGTAMVSIAGLTIKLLAEMVSCNTKKFYDSMSRSYERLDRK